MNMRLKVTHMSGIGQPEWPTALGEGAVRWTRRSQHYHATVAFYRDLVRLPVIAEFSSSFGEDGTVFGLPDASTHLEILRDEGPDRSTDADEIVLYLNGADAVEAALTRLREAGHVPQVGHPYWEANRAVTYRDPDGRGLVFASWVFGQVPDPVDRDDPSGPDLEPLRIEWDDSDRSALRALFAEAEDSAAQLDSYIDEGRVLTARIGAEVVGHLQLVEPGREGEIELKSMAVVAERRGTGIGRSLVENAVAAARADGYSRMTVATAAADIDNLRFYQRRGFRLSSVEADAFGVEAGYAAGLTIDGIPLRDRVWFTQEL
jgi:GNAT superfamily N-acetyltransferase